MRSPDFLSQFTTAIMVENSRQPIYDGAEPDIVAYREELEMEIVVKRVEFKNGKMRVVIG